MGITLGSNFDVQTGLPLDSRESVADSTARDAINSGVRWEGMIVYVIADTTAYQLVGGITNSDWVAVGSGGAFISSLDTAIGSVPNAAGMSVSSGVLTLQPADATNPGILSASPQNISGAKTFFGNIARSSETGLTAYAGGGQGSAQNITADISQISTCATAGDSVVLPTIVLGGEYVVINDGAAACNVFPGVGDAIDALGTDVAYSLPAGSNARFIVAASGVWKSVVSGSGGGGGSVVPTIQKFTSGSGTYTPTGSPAYIKVRMVGGGGGGAGSGTGAQTDGSAGGDTTFGGSTAGGGGEGTVYGGVGQVSGAGGSVTLDSGASELVCSTGSGGSAGLGDNNGPPAGGSSPFGGGGYGGAGNAAANSGSGGGGANGTTSTATSGGSGASGGYLEFIIESPGSISYSIGGGGSGGSGGTGGVAGGSGADGVIIVEEYA